MIDGRRFGVGALALVLFAPGALAQGARYRTFELGANLASVVALTGVPATEAKTVHDRPAMMQDLEWKRPYTTDAAAAQDPVRQITFSFYSDQLFRLVIDYDRERTEGMNDADMVEAISAMYGPTIKPAVKTSRPGASIEEQSGTRVAGWGGAEYTAVLYRFSYASGFRMIVTSVRLAALARAADARAVALDERDAPQRERAREKKEADAALALRQKARQANKAAFIP